VTPPPPYVYLQLQLKILQSQTAFSEPEQQGWLQMPRAARKRVLAEATPVSGSEPASATPATAAKMAKNTSMLVKKGWKDAERG
jgi:hypothetical protein